MGTTKLSADHISVAETMKVTYGKDDLMILMFEIPPECLRKDLLKFHIKAINNLILTTPTLHSLGPLQS